MRSQKILAIVGATLAVFGVVCPPSFVLGVELMVAATLLGQLWRTLPQWSTFQPLAASGLAA
jgi:hypothetical protein